MGWLRKWVGLGNGLAQLKLVNKFGNLNSIKLIRLEDLFNVVTTSAKATLGIVKRTVKKGYYNNPKLLRRLVGTYQGAIMHYAAWLFFYRLAIMPTFSRAQFNCINMCSARITCESGDPRYLMALSYENCAILFHKIA